MDSQSRHRQDPIRLLLVDDEEGFVDVLTKRLKRRNIITAKAYNGVDGIQLLMKSPFDVAVVDLKMEGMDGIELLKVFKNMDPNLPVIILTGHGSAQASRDGIAFGAYDYLSKPYDLEELIAKIEAAVIDGGKSNG